MRKAPLSLLMLLVFAVPLAAQRSTANIRGSVRDPAGEVVAGAEVSLVGADTGYARATTTDSSGTYTFADARQATVFMTEAVEALMYLGCDVHAQ